MGHNREFRERDIEYEINLKCKTIDTVRTARVLASERLYGYAEKWELIFLAMSIISAGLLVYSLLNPENQVRLTLSALFSIYSLLIQNFVAKLNYNERALRFHYHQLDLEIYLLELKYIFLEEITDKQEKYNRYKKVMEKYQVSLQGYENHSKLDHNLARKRFEDGKKIENGLDKKLFSFNWKNFIENHDFSWNKFLIWFQYLIILLVPTCYLLLSIS